MNLCDNPSRYLLHPRNGGPVRRFTAQSSLISPCIALLDVAVDFIKLFSNSSPRLEADCLNSF